MKMPKSLEDSPLLFDDEKYTQIIAMAFLEGAHKWGFPWIPQNGRFVMENLIYMGNVGVPHFRKLTWLEL